jgi:O-acetylserine/cysteine efflux transporter
VFVLFTIWSASFIAIEELVAGEGARFDWLSLAAARFVPVALICGGWCLSACREEALRAVRDHWRRLVVAGIFCVPGYNLAMYAGQQHRVAAPIASLLTCLAPLFVMVLSAVFLGERITARRIGGFLLALAGLVLVATAREGNGADYPLLIGLTALAPLSWSIYTVLTKPVTGKVRPLVWTYLVLCFGGAPFVLALPFSGGPELARLDLAGFGMLAFLALLSTVLAFALWTWLLRHLPATTVGFTIFLNPPMTTGYKAALAALFPVAFAFTVTGGEVLGGVLLLAGVAVAVLRVSRARPSSPARS